MAASKLEILEHRLQSLERIVFGAQSEDVDYPKDRDQVVNTLVSLDTQFRSKIAGKPRIENLLKTLPELQQHLDPARGEKMALAPDVMAEIVLAEEALIRQQAANLEKMQDMLGVLGSEHIKCVPMLEGRLYDLCKVHVEQQERESQLTEEVRMLLQQYNSIVALLSKQFVEYDELITRMELAQQPRPAAD